MIKKLSFILILVLSGILIHAQNGVYSVLDFGAINDGTTLNTPAIQEAVDKCASEGGGKVVVPPGKYLTGSIFLKSNICFEVFPGAELIFNDDIENCPIVDGRWEGIERRVYAALFTGHHLENVSIVGRGKINGQGEKWWKAYEETFALRRNNGITEREPENPPGSPLKVPRPRLINLYHCKNVLISELTFIDSPSWTIHPVYCENVVVEKISIIQPYESPNTDGINPESCKNVRISNCFVDCGDDCITIKSGYNEDGRRVGIPCENIAINNCTFAHGRSAVGIGSEMSGGVKNVTISNCVFNGTLRGIRLKTNRARGGTVENYRADNIVMTNVETAISIDMYYGRRDGREYPVTEKTPVFRNIHLSNIIATEVKKSVDVTGLPESWLQDFSITNSTFRSKEGMSFSYVDGLRLSDVAIECEDEKPLRIELAKNIEVDNFGTKTSLKDTPLIDLKQVDNVFIHNNQVARETEIFLRAAEANDVELSNNRLRNAKIIQ